MTLFWKYINDVVFDEMDRLEKKEAHTVQSCRHGVQSHLF